jgi:hypothetical protein
MPLYALPQKAFINNMKPFALLQGLSVLSGYFLININAFPGNFTRVKG